MSNEIDEAGHLTVEVEPTPGVLLLPPGTEREPGEPRASQGRPFNQRHPYLIGLMGAFGFATAYLIVRGLADITGVLVIIGVSLFIAIGLNPVVEFLERRRLPRKLAVALVVLGFVTIVGSFIALAIPPISHEVHHLIVEYPRYRRNLLSGRGWAGSLVRRFHLAGYLNRPSRLLDPLAGGVFGAGKMIVSIGVATVSVIALTIYFLVALPGVTRLWLGLIPRSRRPRVEVLTEEVFDRVGGFMLGNLLTSLISGVGTFVWLTLLRVPFAPLLALFVALFDLIPMVGSTIAGIVVSLVALSRGLPIAIATAVFYVVYRLLEDYFLNPRVMKHTVKVTPGLTIIATLIGGSLLGLVGALVAIPVAATVHLLIEEVALPRQNER